MGRVAVNAAVALVAAGIALAQSGAVFEATRVWDGTIYKRGGSRTPEQITFGATRVGDIIAFAYGFPADRVDRQPRWMNSDLFDVSVTTPGPTSLAEQKVLLQKLLEERFGLVVHKLTQNGWVYTMTAGPKVTLTPAGGSDEAAGFPEFPVRRPADDLPVLYLPGGVARNTSSVLIGAKHVSMNDLADWMSSRVKHPVIDKTGIPGFFDLEVQGSQGGAEQTIAAVEKSLGLQFKVELGPVETLILDQAEELR